MKRSYWITLPLIWLFACLTPAFGQPAGADHRYELQLRSGKLTPAPNLADFEKAPAPGAEELTAGRYFRILQFSSIPTEQDRERLRQLGAELLDYLPHHAYLASLAAGFDRRQLRQFGVRAVLPLQPEMKLAPALLQQDYPAWALRPNQEIELIVRYYPSVAPAQAEQALRGKGFTILSRYDFSHLLNVRVPLARLRELAALPFVSYAEAIDAPAQPENYRGRTLHRNNTLASDYAAGRHYDGTGVKVALGDDGIVGPHIDYNGRVNQGNVSSNNGNHGDHCAGIIMAAGNLDPKARGNAPGADLHVYNVWDAILLTPTTYTTPGIRITSTSYSNGCNAGYTSFAVTADQQIRQMPSLMHVFSSGNEGASDCGYGAGSGWGNITGGVKIGKNVIAVGNLSYTDGLASSSSRGPATDGRIKPDVCAMGTSVYSTLDVNTYGFMSGTSMACPGVSGTLAQLYQAYKSLKGTEPPSALMKGILMNTADDLGNPGPDFQFGYGRVNALRAVKVLEENRYLSNTVSQGTVRTHTLTVPANTKQVKVMVYWADYEGASNAAVALVNNLNMTLTDPAATVYQPWVLNHAPDVASLSAPATRGVDNLNNAEQVTLDSPAAGTYTVTVTGATVPRGPQTYYVVYEYLTDEVELTYPIGGEAFVPGQSETVRWDATGTSGSFKLEYSLNNGSTWTTISSTINAANRHYDWTPPTSAVTGQALLRVTRGTSSSVSKAPFTILGVPSGLSIQTVCTNYTTLSWNAVTGATGYEVSVLGVKYMETIGTTSSTNFTVSGTNAAAEDWFSVKALGPNGAVGRRAVALKKAVGLLNCPVPLDAAVTAILSPAAALPGCQPNNALSVAVKLENKGTSTLSGIPVSYRLNMGATVTETYSGSLAPGASVTFTFAAPLSLSGPGSATLTCWAALPADANPANDQSSRTLEVYSSPLKLLPFQDDFESFSACGTDADCDATVCSLPNGWRNETNGGADAIDWRTNSGSTPSSGTGPVTDFAPGTVSGKYLYLESSSCYGQSAHLVSPCLDLSGAAAPRLTFQYHLYGTAMGELHLDALTASGWVLDIMPAVAGNQGNSWQQATVSLSAFAGQIINLRFRGITGTSFTSDMALDDIKVFETAGPPSVVFSTSHTMPCLGRTVQFTDQSTNSPSGWSWSFSPGTVSFVNGTSAASQHPQVQFNAAGSYNVSLTVTNANGSQTLNRFAYVRATNGTTLPHDEDLDGGTFPPSGWSLASAGGAYTWEARTNTTGPEGTSTVVYINNYDYNNLGAEDALLTLPLDLTGTSSPVLVFDVAYARYSAANSDALRIDISTDCGLTFPETVYLKAGSTLATVADQTLAWFPTSSTHWRTDTVNLRNFANAQVMLRFVNINAFGNNLFLDNVRLGTGMQLPLPVDWLRFKAEPVAGQVELSWEVAQEINNDRFEVQRSADGQEWQQIGTVAGAGTSDKTRSYAFTDKQPGPQPLLYYRLRQVDTNGTYSFSPTAAVHQESSGWLLQLYPNPTRSRLQLEYRLPSGLAEATFQLHDALGREVQRLQLQESAGSRSTDVSALPAGLYFYTCSAGGTVLQTGKLLKE